MLVGAMNLVTLAGSTASTQNANAIQSEQKMVKMNSEYLKSIESSWIRVPNICKARGFNAEPVALQTRTLSEKINNIYASFEA